MKRKRSHISDAKIYISFCSCKCLTKKSRNIGDICHIFRQTEQFYTLLEVVAKCHEQLMTLIFHLRVIAKNIL